MTRRRNLVALAAFRLRSGKHRRPRTGERQRWDTAVTDGVDEWWEDLSLQIQATEGQRKPSGNNER